MLVFSSVKTKRASYERFAADIARIAWILECHHVAGAASFILKAAVADTAALDRLVSHLSQYSETTTAIVLSTTLEHRQFARARGT